MNNENISTLTLLKETFKTGEQILVIDVNDCVEWGLLINFWEYDMEIYSYGFGRRSAGTRKIDYDDIRFISHTDFNVEKLSGADGSESLLIGDSIHAQRYIPTIPNMRPPERRVYFGDPFVVSEITEQRIYNLGNSGEWYWGEDNEEAIYLKDKNGAEAFLYDSETVFQ